LLIGIVRLVYTFFEGFNYMKRLYNSTLYRKKLISLIAGFVLAFSATGATLPTATQTANAMKIGWNLGNTLEAIGGETAWGAPVTTQKFIDFVKSSGFNAIRLPCAWDIHSDQTTHVINSEWIARVKEVVDYCIKDSLYVIINIHWDNGWLENNCTQEKKESVNVKQKAYWTQIANYFKDYDGHLLFASANEPNVEDATQMSVLMSYHQTFVDAVRATGGNNSSRVLVIQGPSTDIDKTNKLWSSMPVDQISNHLIFEIHDYTPWNFCGMSKDESWGNMFYYWGKEFHSTTDPSHNATWGEEAAIDELFSSMKTKFVDKGIPVIIGEFGANKRISLTGAALALHTASREYFYKYVSTAAVNNGMILFYWDTGNLDSDYMTLLDRKTLTIADQGALNALMQGAGVTKIASKKNNAGSRMVYPESYSNTFSEYITLVISDPARVKNVSLFDQLGRQVKSFDHSTINKKMHIGQDLKAGAYLLKINGGSETQLIIKTK
jgi:endoglucanase